MDERAAGEPAQGSEVRAGLSAAESSPGTIRGTTEEDAQPRTNTHHGGPLDAQTALVAAQALKIEQLTQALSSRDLIGQAKGILMERHRLTADQAFKLLVRTSQNNNHKLIDVAGRLVHSGELNAVDRPGPPAPPD